GADVAWRALDPRLPLRAGFVAYPVRFPPGSARNTFTTLTSLLPGTVPAGEQGGELVYHCLDVDQPVVSQLAAEEAALSRAVRDAGVSTRRPRFHPGDAGAGLGSRPARSGRGRSHDGGTADRDRGYRRVAPAWRGGGSARGGRCRVDARTARHVRLHRIRQE